MSSSYDDIRNMSIDLTDESVDDVIVAIPLGESAAPGRTVGKLANQRGLFRLYFDKGLNQWWLRNIALDEAVVIIRPPSEQARCIPA